MVYQMHQLYASRSYKKTHPLHFWGTIHMNWSTISPEYVFLKRYKALHDPLLANIPLLTSNKGPIHKICQFHVKILDEIIMGRVNLRGLITMGVFVWHTGGQLLIWGRGRYRVLNTPPPHSWR